MHSIRTRITLIMLSAMLISILSFGIIGIYFIREESRQMSARNLHLVCENRKDSLNEYLSSIQQSVSMISRYAIDSIDSVALLEGGVLGASGHSLEELPGRSDAQKRSLDTYLDSHLELIENAFKSIANHTNGLSSCYYRMNPEITSVHKGFFFSRSGNYSFQRIEMTDLKAYPSDDIDHVGWYYLPLRQGRPSWLKPYHSAKMDDQVISYVVPLFKSGTFIGIIGMDIRFETLVTQIQQFTNFKTGYFALTDESGRIYYHPEYAQGTELKNALPELHRIIRDFHMDSSSDRIIRYDKNHEKWQMTYTTIANDLKLAAIVRESEINAHADNLTRIFAITGAGLLLAFSLFITFAMKRITDPLKRLTVAAKKLSSGDYNTELSYESDDEVGVLTSTFGAMRDRLKANINELTSKAFTDDLTGVKSRHAYTKDIERLDRRIENHLIAEFALAVFDLNNLKIINDRQGHAAGDRSLKEASRSICTFFKHSPVYRIGGDEFVVILEGTDYEQLEPLFSAFEAQMDANLAQGGITISSGYSRFDPARDESTRTVLSRADKIMYVRKKTMKEKQT